MAFRSTAGRLRGYVTSTSPKLKAYAPTAEFGDQHDKQAKKAAIKGDYVPVYVALGMIALSVSLGLFTAKQQIVHSPNVLVKKKTRETLPEVEDPDRVVDLSDKFMKRSFFRKIAHIQEFDGGLQILPDDIRKDALAHSHPRAETLKSVGVDPKLH